MEHYNAHTCKENGPRTVPAKQVLLDSAGHDQQNEPSQGQQASAETGLGKPAFVQLRSGPAASRDTPGEEAVGKYSMPRHCEARELLCSGLY